MLCVYMICIVCVHYIYILTYSVVHERSSFKARTQIWITHTHTKANFFLCSIHRHVSSWFPSHRWSHHQAMITCMPLLTADLTWCGRTCIPSIRVSASTHGSPSRLTTRTTGEWERLQKTFLGNRKTVQITPLSTPLTLFLKVDEENNRRMND